MKKVLSAVLALGMVAGVATTASAAFDNFRVRGYYDLEGMSFTNLRENNGVALNDKGNGSGVTASWYQQNFRVYPVIEVNDKIKMSAEVRMMDDDRWGTDDGTKGDRSTDINKLYMEWTMNYGVLRMGRIPWGAWGHDFVNASGRQDGFVYFSSLLPKPWGLTAVYGKVVEDDATYVAPNTYVADQDKDYYDVRVNYTTDTVNFHTRVGFMDYQDVPTDSVNEYRWGGTGTVKFMDNFYVDFEWDKLFGDVEYDGAALDEDYNGLAAMVKVGGNFGALDAGLTYWYVSGDDDDTDTDLDAYGSSLKDYKPLMIMTGADTSLLNNDTSGGYWAGVNGDTHGVDEAGANGLVVNFGYKVNDKLSLTSAIGTAWAAEEDIKIAAGVTRTRDDDYGFEIDLGLEYKLLDNLTYRADFAYWDAGEYFTDGYKDTGDVTATGETEEDDVMMVTHGLNMTF